MESLNNANVISKNEASILEEVMNIAFGKASSDLAELIDIRILLNVPVVQTLKAEDLQQLIKEETKEYGTISIIEQNFWGKYNGSALLVFPSTAIEGLVSLFDDDEESLEKSALLEKETLLEVGNILIGACVGKVAELLDDIVSFSPPRLLPEIRIDNFSKNEAIPMLDDPGKYAVLMKTVFHVEDKDISGFLFLVANHQSMEWLKTALNVFMEKF